MNDLKINIDISKLPGPKRGDAGCLYYDDHFSLSPNNVNYALSYSVTEVRMGCDIGCLGFGSISEKEINEIYTVTGIYVTMWNEEWIKWLDDKSFIIKSQYYDGKNIFMPLILFNINKTFSIIKNTNSVESNVSIDYNEIKLTDPTDISPFNLQDAIISNANN